jgi:hypothetical protein
MFLEGAEQGNHDAEGWKFNLRVSPGPIIPVNSEPHTSKWRSDLRFWMSGFAMMLTPPTRPRGDGSLEVRRGRLFGEAIESAPRASLSETVGDYYAP